MRNLLRSTLYLSVFAFAGILFQISCSNSDNPNPSTNSTPIGKIIYQKGSATGLQIWTCDYDGTNQNQVPISLPSGIEINTNNAKGTPRLSPDGQKVFFVTIDYNVSQYKLYSCDIDGSNLQPIVSQPYNTDTFEIGGVY